MIEKHHVGDWSRVITLESWFTNLEQTALNRCQPLPAPYKRLPIKSLPGFLNFQLTNTTT